jgi:alkaline phosphatase D
LQTRRQFITSAGGFAAATVFAPQVLAQGLTSARSAPLLRGGKFSDGLISGDPTPGGITLWTRVADVGGAGRVELEVARDRSFRHVVTRKLIGTNKALNHSVKARVEHLKPHEQYYYRFSTKGEHSEVGRFRTALPKDSKQPVTFAFWSCQDYTHGYYNAYEAMLRDDYDFVICLGDYIYAEAYHSIADGTGVRDDRIGSAPLAGNGGIVREAVTYQDYLDKYSLYRSDKLLREIHARYPLVMLWDDHEVQDNYAGEEANGGLDPAKRYSPARKAAAYKAFYNSMPAYVTGKRQYRTLNFGRTVDLVIMDQRRYRANQPCNDAVAPPCADWDQPRDFLGQTQMKYVQNQLQKSKAAWKVMANEVTIMPTKVLGGSYFGYDNWDGYPREREQLLTFIRDKGIKDVVFVTGDIHTFITGDVRTNMGTGDTVAIELVGGSVTSQGLGETNIDAGGGVTIQGNDQNPHTDPGLIAALKGINPWVKAGDFDHHGFGKVRASQTSFDCELVRMATIKKRSKQTLPPGSDYRVTIKRGQKSLF